MLRVSGLDLVDDYGEKVYLQGITVDGNERRRLDGSTATASDPGESWFKESDVTRLKGLGCNLIDLIQIRVPRLMSSMGTINIDYFTTWLDPWVDWCERNGIYCMPSVGSFRNYKSSLVNYGPYMMPRWLWEDLYPENWWLEPNVMEIQADIIHRFYDSAYTDQEPKRQAWLDIMAYLADRYKYSPNVIFSTSNEPMHFTYDYMTDAYADYMGGEYSKLMTRAIDAMRGAGAEQAIFIDRPYLKTYVSHVKPIDRPNMVWESHAYVSRSSVNLEGWKNIIDRFIQKFIYEFGKPYYQGEYGIDPPTYKNQLVNWRATLAGEVSYLDSFPLCGRTWHSYGQLQGEYYDWYYETYEGVDWYTEEESQFILDTVFKYIPPAPISPFGRVLGALGTVLSTAGFIGIIWHSSKRRG